MAATDGTVLDVQFSAAAADWPLLLESTLAAESAGFGAVWVFDHLAGRSLRGDGMLECFTWLGALAAATSDIALGSLVTNVWNREPGVVAVAAASVEHISARPFYLGLGAGTSPSSPFAAEQHAVGARIGRTVAERHERVVATLELLDAMWDDDRAAHFDSFPRPARRPITIIGVSSVALATIAGRCADGINVRWDHPDRAELLAAADAARPPERPPLLRTAYVPWDDALVDPAHPSRVDMADAGVDRLVLSSVARPDPDRIARLTP